MAQGKIGGIPSSIEDIEGTDPLIVDRIKHRGMDAIAFIYEGYRLLAYGERCCCSKVEIESADDVSQIVGEIDHIHRYKLDNREDDHLVWDIEVMNQKWSIVWRGGAPGIVKLNGRGGL